MIESCRIIYGLFNIFLSAFCFTSESTYSIIMELLILEFLVSFPLILSLIRHLNLSIESSKGIYSIFIFNFPFLIINIISNDFLTINQLNKFSKYINLGDIIAVLGSIDFVLGSVDLLFSIELINSIEVFSGFNFCYSILFIHFISPFMQIQFIVLMVVL